MEPAITFSQQNVYSLIRAFAGQANILTIPRAFITLTGDINSALLLSQLLYWHSRSEDGWTYKTFAQWEDELGLSDYKVNKARKHLESLGLITTRVAKANGAPTVHYRVNEEVLVAAIAQFLQNGNPKNQDMENPKTGESKTQKPVNPLTETPTETPTETVRVKKMTRTVAPDAGASDAACPSLPGVNAFMHAAAPTEPPARRQRMSKRIEAQSMTEATEPLGKRHTMSNADRAALEEHFVSLTSIPAPRAMTPREKRNAGQSWWTPLREIAALVDYDVSQAQMLITEAWQRLDGQVTVSCPRSLIKTATAIAAEWRRNRGGAKELIVEF